MKKLIAILIVNLLTSIRVIGVICLVPIYIYQGGLAAAEWSIFCYLTDWIDGILARKWHAATFFGSAFDGAADKLFSLANLIILLTSSKYAIFPILCEVIIVLIQTIKYYHNINVKSSMVGKIKTWVVSLTIIVLYLISDIEAITILNPAFINQVQSISHNFLYAIIFAPLYLFEILTIISYLAIKKEDIPNEVKIDPKEIMIRFKPKTSFKNVLYNFYAFWLNNEFYEKYKDSAGLKTIRKYLKGNR